MAGAGTVTVNIVGNADKLEKTLGKVGKSLDETFKSAGKKMQNVGKKMSTFVTLPLLGAGVAAFKMGSDFNESFSKMNTVFGKSAKEIDDWSKTTAKNIGLSRTEALGAAGDFGNMFVQLGIGTDAAADMSTGIVNLAADFASFHNADITEVINAQSAAFRGEYDSLQRFLPLINAAAVEQKALEMTGKAATKELTAQEKALAVNALMMEGAGDAAGDFARTADGAANKQRILTAQFKDAAAELGTKLLPIGQKVLGWVTNLTEKFAGLSPGVQTAILAVAGLAAALGPLIGLIGSLTVALTFLAAHPLVLVVGAFTVLTAGVILAKNELIAFPAPIITALNGFLGYIRTLFVNPILESFDAIISGAASAFGWIPGLGEKIREANTDFDNMKRAVDSALSPIPYAFEKATASVRLFTGELEHLNRVPINQGLTTMILPGGPVRAMASGGSFGAGTTAVVGEAGPELVRFGAAGTVIPNSSLGGSTTVNNYFTVTGAVDPSSVARQIHGILLEHQRRTGGLGLV